MNDNQWEKLKTMSIFTSTRYVAAVALTVGLFSFAVPDAQAYLGDHGFTVKGQQAGSPFEECWGFRTLNNEIYIDMALNGTWQEYPLLSWLVTGPLSFTYFRVDGTDFTAGGLAFIGFIFGHWAPDADPTTGSLFFGLAGSCDDVP